MRLTDDEIKRCETDFKFFSKKCYKIVDQRRRPVNLVFNETQEKVVEEITSKKRVRRIDLKYRKRGFSTLYCAFGLWKMLFNKYFELSHFMQLMKYEKVFYRKYKIGYNSLPENLKYETDKVNKRGIEFPDLGSYASIVTAGSGGSSARSETLAMLHLSEPAFYSSLNETLLAARDSIPDEDDTYIFLESTPNKINDDFAKLYFNAKDGINEYDAHFYPWHENVEFAIPLEKDEVIELTDEEQRVVGAYGLSLEQIKWRRQSIKKYISENETQGMRIFKREFPESDADCFLMSTSAFFNPDIVQSHRYAVEADMKNGDLKSIMGYELFSNEHKISMAKLKIFFQPEVDGVYKIGADVGKGIEKGDFSALVVWQLKDGVCEQVAQFRDRLSLSAFAKTCNDVGRWYNNAEIAIEVNKHDAVAELLFDKYQYPNLWMDDRKSRAGVTKRISRIGFYTSEQSKKMILDRMSIALATNDLLPNDLDFLAECLYYEDDNGKLGAPDGMHDDLVMAGAIGYNSVFSSSQAIEILTPVSLNRPNITTKQEIEIMS